MTRSKVAVLKTTPETVLEDYGKLMRLADYSRYLPKDKDTALKINISWHYYYPACSTTPWQIEGVIKTLLEDGYSRDRIHACHNKTVVVSAKRGEVANKHLPVVHKYGLRNIHLYEDGEEWVRYEPKAKMRVLHDIYPRGIEIPKRLIGENVLHLPTMKTHVFTTMTGAMKNAFGGLLHEKRHWTHSVIHETLVDLLAIQKEIHTGIFAVMDGTIAGDGPGPRCMVPHIKNTILASADQVAIDAIAAKMMGFDPLSLPFIRLAHEAGLGVRRPAGDRDRRRGHRGRQLAFPREQEHLRQLAARSSSTTGRSSRSRSSCCERCSRPGHTSLRRLPRLLLASVHRPGADALRPPHVLGQTLPILLS